MQKYSLATSLMFTAGTLAVLYFLVIGMGAAWVDDDSGVGHRVDRRPMAARASACWPAQSRWCSRSRPAASNRPWRGWRSAALIAVAGCVLVSVLLTLYLTASQSFGEAYGPLAGFMGVLLWAYGSSIALFFGLSFAAQLEAVRAGVPAPRDEVKVRDSEPDAVDDPVRHCCDASDGADHERPPELAVIANTREGRAHATCGD